ncbi:nucleolar protein 11-like isoform X1 [Gadus morhua]|uniref:nucleolar protein 11-like isoform X1 n=1 Tax=Gadus morhua TaxID=8049 RepID=UPI0011B85EDA|nr:nucleolar protein 11 isoform X1 [Gadus morhua]
MAALYEGYTLCALLKTPNSLVSGINGIEVDSDIDHVVVTDSTRSVTLYKVSDQKPLGSWTLKQGQSLSCPAVYNAGTKEYVSVSDGKVIRVWKAEDLLLDKAFKATLSANVWRVHAVPGGGLFVLFVRGAVRLLDDVLAAPQQPIEEVLGQEENIRWSATVTAETQHFVIFTTEQNSCHFLYVQRLKPNSLQKFSLEPQGPAPQEAQAPLSFSACYQEGHIRLLCLYPDGHVYQSLVSMRGPPALPPGGAAPLPRTQLLGLHVGGALLEAASAIYLDDCHVAVVGAPHPAAGPGTNFLCIWNTNFQTLQAGKEIPGKVYGQLWSYAGKLFIPHGRSLTVIPYECPTSSLATALGKLKRAGSRDSRVPACVPSWSSLLDGRTPSDLIESSQNKAKPVQASSAGPADHVLGLVETATVEAVQREVEALLSRADPQDLNPWLGQLACSLVSRSSTDPPFYPASGLAALVRTGSLCHSVCPELLLLALEKRDYLLAQLCLQAFPDVPENITCCCLKTFLRVSVSSAPEAEVQTACLEPSSLSFMETHSAPQRGIELNGFTSTGGGPDPEKPSSPPIHTCPLGVHKAVLLNEVIQTPYSDAFLLPHLKDLSPQQLMLFLQYLHFLYLQYSQDSFKQEDKSIAPTLTQIMDWVCLLLDAHFTVLVMTPEARGLLVNLHIFVRSQVRFCSELGKLEGSLQEIQTLRRQKEMGQYCIQVIKIF